MTIGADVSNLQSKRNKRKYRQRLKSWLMLQSLPTQTGRWEDTVLNYDLSDY